MNENNCVFLIKGYKIRSIAAKDDAAIAKIIRTNLQHFHLDIPGTAYFDPELDHLSTFYAERSDKRAYFIVTNEDDKVVGGVGFAEFEGLPKCAELQKLYLDETVKGLGLSKEMMKIVEVCAKKLGYEQLYLETHTNLAVAVCLYEKLGYESVPQPVPTVHTTMNRFYLKKI
ncbi:GNAT family N-acetyltransferase [Succinatimonas hippei]|uniref:GNAT family N-acetyltransferase n=1 Tax=Succinatimonas hippei TaxID=626938 RepID=UPI00201102B4|nr:GNAT family N-acetyltransferase [Succinatimonas hippei]MCL1602790.1 GNAT family N-acetyltransferase [Succinatimonas hippei]MDM8119907.1 GNAT family N-acetyltransferase [Succinatimonas hippei]